MSDIKTFQRNHRILGHLTSTMAPLEKALQTLFEKNLEKLLGVRFVVSEIATAHGGRMDTLGFDENGYLVIIKYKQ
jgi:RecB family endonuclease NucS